MSFRSNESQQMSIFDSTYNLTEREKKALENSWAKVFAEEIFPCIDEERFSVLYSEKGSRPNTPVNVIIGALILKELYNLSDDQIVENLMLDFRYQYALHTTSFEEQPLSDKSLSRFRGRCYDYETSHDVDLWHDCVTDLAAKSAKLMNIDGHIRRMDSLMIESNIRKLSRMELIYKCIAKVIIYLNNNGMQDRIFPMDHYCEANDQNSFIYHCNSDGVEDRMEILMRDIDLILERCADLEDVTEYQLFLRCASEQTIVENGKRRLKTHDDGIMKSSMMQNPSDPDATYREKTGKKYRGYAANVVESVGDKASIVTDYQFDSNNTSDSAFFKEYIESLPESEEKITVITDGAYSGDGNVELASSKNVELVTTALSGKDVNPIMKGFKFNDEGTQIIQCPQGYAPKISSYNKQSESCTASFEKGTCDKCIYRQECKAKLCKRVNKVKASVKAQRRLEAQDRMKTEDFKNLARLRNGVETIPSILKNIYSVNKMFVRGKKKCKFFFGAKVAALNFKKLFNYLKGLGNYAQNPIFC